MTKEAKELSKLLQKAASECSELSGNLMRLNPSQYNEDLTAEIERLQCIAEEFQMYADDLENADILEGKD